jgi:hypothetical protein
LSGILYQQTNGGTTVLVEITESVLKRLVVRYPSYQLHHRHYLSLARLQPRPLVLSHIKNTIHILILGCLSHLCLLYSDNDKSPTTTTMKQTMQPTKLQ